MRRFIRIILIYATIIAVITGCVNAAYISKVRFGRDTAKFINVPDGIQICNLGSSHGVQSYYYEDLENRFKCFNFALDSQSIGYDKRILDYYHTKLADNAVVIIDISYFICYGIPEVENEDFLSRNKRYYRFLPPEYILNYDLYTALVEVGLEATCVSPIDCIRTIISPTNYLYLGSRSYFEQNRTVDLALLKEDVELSAKRHIIDNKRDENGNLIINKEAIESLYEIIRICRSCGATPIMVTCPYLSEYKEQIQTYDPSFLDDFNKWINMVSLETGVAYYDYSSDPRFCGNYSLFYNGDHMNSTGARMFTDILFDEVIENIVMDYR